MNLLLGLARTIAGDFSNSQQSQDFPQDFAHIRVFFRPLPQDFFGGVGFYSEQVYDHDLWTPYRQGVHRFLDGGDHVYIENFALKDSIRFAGGGREPSILKTISHDDIQRRYNCSMVFRWEQGRFVGAVEGNQCLIEKNGKSTYLISEVVLTETTFDSWDRGMEVGTDLRVWGSDHGPLKFVKRESFAHEVTHASP